MLRSKSAVVTGSTSGIGLAIARAMAKEGANVVLNGFGDAGEIEARAAAASRPSSASRRSIRPADMAKPDEIAGMIRQAEEAFGAVDMLVNNAGIQHVSPIEEFPPEKWDADHRDQPLVGLPRHPRRGARHEGGAAGGASSTPPRRIRSSPRPSSRPTSRPSTASPASPRPSRSSSRRTASPCNCISPGYVWTPLVEQQIPDTMKARSLTQGAGHQRRAARRRSRRSSSSPSSRSRRSRSSCAPTRRARSPAPTCRWTAAGRRNERARGLLRRRPSRARRAEGREGRVARAAGRRRARRLHLGRARRHPRGRAARHRGDHRRQRRRHERGRAGRRLDRGRRRRRPRAAAPVLEARQPRRRACRRCSGSCSTASSAPWGAGGSPAEQWLGAWSRNFSPYELNPLDINPLRDALDELIDFEPRARRAGR